MLDRNTIIRIILFVTIMFIIVYFAPNNRGQNNNSDSADIVIIDGYDNIPGFEYANDIVVLHDNKRNVTCWAYNYKSISCISDKDLQQKIND